MSRLFEKVRRNIKQLRLARGWTQEQLAKKAKVTKTDVCRMETGTNKDMKLSTLEKFAKIFGVGEEELMRA